MTGRRAREALTERIIEAFRTRTDVLAIYRGGSGVESEDEFSDIDLWVVVDEIFLQPLIVAVPTILSLAGRLVAVHAVSPAHFMAVYDDLTVVDLTAVTTSGWYNLREGRLECLLDTRDPVPGARASDSSTQLLMAYAALSRAVAKLRGKQLWAACRIVSRLRESVLVPELERRFSGHLERPDAWTPERLPPELGGALLDTFCRPDVASLSRAMAAALTIMDVCMEENGGDPTFAGQARATIAAALSQMDGVPVQ